MPVSLQVIPLISIHALLAESDVMPVSLQVIPLISIHALLAESDQNRPRPSTRIYNFYPRSPCGERRDVIAVMTDAQSISIHALLAESDNADCNYRSGHRYFYPRSPCGERPRRRTYQQGEKQAFLSTLSLRRATTHPVTVFICVIISIHALLAESDNATQQTKTKANEFLSTLSLRRATK